MGKASFPAIRYGASSDAKGSKATKQTLVCDKLAPPASKNTYEVQKAPERDRMSDALTGKNQEGDVESALLDAELFIKYQVPDRAIRRLRAALERNPRSIQLRERLREIAQATHPEEAARQCLALASLYIEREELQTAHDRLLEAKNLDPRISIAPGLDAIRRIRRPSLQQSAPAAESRIVERPKSTLAGDLASVSIFDAVQVIENSRLTGTLAITSDALSGRVFFNEGRIVGAETGETTGADAFRKVVEVTSGTFDFEKSVEQFPITINAASNTNLILDSLRQLDEENM
jgi:hypothetical protein